MGKTSAADLEIISGLFLSAAEQMRRTLVRTAFNAVIYEVLDFGISIAEALSSKKPVLTTNKVNIYKIIKKYNAGIITNDTYTSYLNGLKKFINMTDEKYINMKNNSLKCFQENFYGEKYFNNLMKYIKQEINS